MPEEHDLPQPQPEQPSLFGGVSPDELLARALHTARMSGSGGSWQPPTFEEAAQLFPGYEVVKLLGRGGMGAVYQARQIALERLVALKLLPLEVSADRDFADRFRREARAMARLQHPNIVTVFDFGQTGVGHLFFAMEFVAGANLAEIIHQAGLDPDRALSIAAEICSALAYAHGKGVVHRDIKPANVMIDIESQVKVADFGLARLTDSTVTDLSQTLPGALMGTLDYMAPEQRQGANVDHRADIYSLGVLLYEMLCREVPKGAFQPPSFRTGCDARIDQIVIKAMQQQPELRYQSTAEMKAEVEAARTPAVMAGAADSTGVQVIQTSCSAGSGDNAELGDPEPPPVARRGGEIRARFGGCSFSLMIAFGVVLFVGIGGYIVLHKSGGKYVADNGEAIWKMDNSNQKIDDTSPSVAPPPVTPPPVIPAPPSEDDMLKARVAKAQKLEEDGEWAPSLDAWLKIVRDFPKSGVGKNRLETMLDGLRARSSPITFEEFKAMREQIIEAAQLDILSAMMLIGDSLRDKEPETAFKWFSAASAKGDANALTQLGFMLETGVGGSKPDYAKAVQCFQAAADKGDVGGKFGLARCYLTGRGLPAKDEKRGAELAREAADAGDARAMILLGDCYTYGTGVEMDFAEAFKLFTRAAEKKNPRAWGELGALYITGRGVPAPDPKKAAELFEKGARAGDSFSMFNYAQCLDEGIGVGKNGLQSQAWYRKAAAVGDERAVEWCQKHGISPDGN